MRIIKGLAVVGCAMIMMIVQMYMSNIKAGFKAGHQACDAQYNMDAMQAFEMDPSEPFVQCHVAVNEASNVAWNKWRWQKIWSRAIEIISARTLQLLG